MAEIILSIEEKPFEKGDQKYLNRYDGYVIKTSSREVLAGINNSSSCCENWGYITSHDDPSEFIGAELLDIRITDSLLNSIELPEDVYEDSAIFITFMTNRGDFQLVVSYQVKKVALRLTWKSLG
jgi:hypothetical protein